MTIFLGSWETIIQLMNLYLDDHFWKTVQFHTDLNQQAEGNLKLL